MRAHGYAGRFAPPLLAVAALLTSAPGAAGAPADAEARARPSPSDERSSCFDGSSSCTPVRLAPVWTEWSAVRRRAFSFEAAPRPGPLSGSSALPRPSRAREEHSPPADEPVAGPAARSRTNGGERPPLLSTPACARPYGWRRFGCDSRYLLHRLTLQEPGDGWRALGIGAAAGLLYAGREEIRDDVLESRSASRTRVYDDARYLSRAAVTPVLAGAFYLAGRIEGEPRHIETAQILLESTLYAAALSGVGSFVLASDRPSVGTGVHFFRTQGHGVSGDVTLAASVAAPLDRRFLRWREGDGTARRVFKSAGRGVLYAAVLLTAMQRMDADRHWAPDVFLGAAAGFASGWSVCAAHEPGGEQGRSDAGGTSLRPALVLLPDRALLAWSF